MKVPRNTTVLYLEDDADSRDLVAYTLKQAGISVISAETVAEAWQAALAYDIDLYLLDGLMADGNSLKLCSDLRMIEPTKPIVFYSGLAFKHDISRGLDAGASGYLVKPYSGDLAEEVLQFIRKESANNAVHSLFLNKETVMKTFETEADSANEDSVKIVDVPAGFANSNWGGSYEIPPGLIPNRQRNMRTMRAARGIF